MKNFYLKLSLLLLAIMASSSLMAVDYIVSGAGSDEVNGTYVEDGTFNDKPQYAYGEYYLSYNNNRWEIWSMFWRTTYYFTSDSGDTPPSTGWDYWDGFYPAPSVDILGSNISYSPETFQESEDNDGTIENTLTITYNLPDGDYFTGDIGVFAATKYSASNIPSGLSMVITKVSNTELSAALSGTATSSNNANDISDLGIAFDNTAFNNGNASAVNNSTKSDLAVNFRDQIDVALSGGDYTTIALAISAASSGDIINISAETFTETSSLKPYSKNLIIQGQGAGSTIIQAASTPNTASHIVFTINANTTTIKNLTIRHGYYAYGSGGGINCSAGELKIINVEISNNYAGLAGGGIFKYGGSLVIENSTINNNTSNGSSSDGGGGIHVYGNATVTINNSTIANNSQTNTGDGGAIYMNDCSISITNSTIRGNTSGIYNKTGGQLTISNTIIAENNTNDYESSTGSLTDNGYNIVKYSNVATTSGGFDNANSILYNTKYATSGSFSSWTKGGNAVGGTLNLSSTLADNNTVNGTQTLALQSGSFAIDNGTGTDLDQRGVPVSGTKEIGAFELNSNWTIWEGSTSSTWGTSSNWSSSPSSSSDIGIKPNCTNNPALVSTESCNSMNIPEGASLTIEDDGALTITENLNNEGSILIESTSSGTGSLIIEGDLTNSGTMTAQRYITGSSLDWHLLSSPVASQEISGNFTDANGYDFYMYYKPGNWWVNKKNTTTAPTWLEANGSNNFTSGQGYMVAYTDPNTNAKSFSGTFNHGTVDIAITNTESNDYSGANLLGNPYPSSIDWSGLDDTYGAVYYYNGSAYVSWNNGAGEGSQYVAPMQGFFIVTSSAGTFSLSNSDRTHLGASCYYKSTKTANNSIVLAASNGSYQDKIYIRFDENSTAEFELQRDAYKFLSSTNGIAQLYAMSGEDLLSIDTRPQTESIQLGFANNEAGTYSIAIKEITDISTAVLEDTKLNIFHNLSDGAYSFDWVLNDDETRFKLHCNTTAVEDISLPEMQVYVAAGNIIIKSQTTAQRIILTDITGRTLGIWESVESIPAPKTAGVYLVSIESDGQRITEKLIVE